MLAFLCLSNKPAKSKKRKKPNPLNFPFVKQFSLFKLNKNPHFTAQKIKAMGRETESNLKLPLFSVQAMKLPEDTGMLTPLHTLASIPFQWEELPGKPRPCTDLIPHPNSTNILNDHKICLEPPPRLYNSNMEFSTKTSSSPTTVLDGPYITAKPKFSSLRFFRRERRQGSFDSTASCKSAETGELFGTSSSSAFVVGDKKKVESKSWWRRRATVKRKAGGGGGNNREIVTSNSFVFTSSTDSDEYCSLKRAALRRSGSFSGLSQAKPHIWASIYDGFKQVLPWKSKKSKKEVLLG